MMSVTNYTILETPIDDLLLTSQCSSLTGLYWCHGKHVPPIASDWVRSNDDFISVVQQLREYFAGDRHTFELSLTMVGTEFQRRVWNQLLRIPYGQTWGYKELAQAVGNPNACRAVGTANGLNPISILVPCHRVIGSNGSLTGYGGGLRAKQWLLDLESKARSMLP